jgi:hypothetical protein
MATHNVKDFMAKRLTLHFVLFTPSSLEEGGPRVYRPYFISAVPWQTPGSGIATLWPIYGDNPAPDTTHFIAQQGGMEAALRMARDAVIEMAENGGLRHLPEDLDQFH